MKKNNPLGEKTLYSSQYDPSLLYAIPRSESRQYLDFYSLDSQQGISFRGEDRWTAYEVSWIDTMGKPQVRIADFIFSADSPNIIESKSFKLYLNSFNQTCFETERSASLAMACDLSEISGAPVSVKFLPLNYCQHYLIQEPIGILLDDLEVSVNSYTPIPDVLAVNSEVYKNEVLYSHLLKTNCPVTGQPDWASIFIEYAGEEFHYESLLAYLISFREHQDYHENSVEKIFCDISHYCKPVSLAVYARYTRRGGLDINPLRSSYPKGKSLLEANILRMIRQ